MPRSGRAFWKGYLRLSLVSIAVEVYHAVESGSEISFRQIHKPSGKRVNYQRVVPGIGEIAYSDIVKGYEIDKDEYVILDPDEIDAIKLESKKTIDLVQFIDAKEIDQRYFERPYFLVPPDDLAAEGYIVIRDALAKTDKVGLAQFTFSGREHLVGVSPLGEGLMLNILRYSNELRSADEYFSDLPVTTKPSKEMIDLATQLIEQKSAPFRPEQFSDRYKDALRALVDEKLKGKTLTAEKGEARQSAKVIDLMEALKRSVQDKDQADASAKPKASKKAKASDRKPAGKKRAS